MSTNTIRLHRVLRATPERVYRAFLDPDAMAKWLPPNGFTGKVHHMDAKVGGSYKMSFTNFSTGKSYSFGVVKAAQARGDFQVLADRGRRALRVHLGADVGAGLRALDAALREAV